MHRIRFCFDLMAVGGNRGNIGWLCPSVSPRFHDPPPYWQFFPCSCSDRLRSTGLCKGEQVVSTAVAGRVLEFRRTASKEREAHISLAEILSALSFALDLTEGALPGHALRSCLLGMRIAREFGFPADRMVSLYYALLLKDVGCSSNAARLCEIIGGGDERRVKAGVKLEDWTRLSRARGSTLRMLWDTVHPNSN